MNDVCVNWYKSPTRRQLDFRADLINLDRACASGFARRRPTRDDKLSRWRHETKNESTSRDRTLWWVAELLPVRRLPRKNAGRRRVVSPVWSPMSLAPHQSDRARRAPSSDKLLISWAHAADRQTPAGTDSTDRPTDRPTPLFVARRRRVYSSDENSRMKRRLRWVVLGLVSLHGMMPRLTSDHPDSIGLSLFILAY